LWDFHLVDPDNRRPVDFRGRREVLGALQARISQAEGDWESLVGELLANPADGRIKAYVLCRTLDLRRAEEGLFARGAYLPLDATGPKRDHVCAFARCLNDAATIVVVPRLVTQVVDEFERPPIGPKPWRDTHLLLPPHMKRDRFQNVFTGEILASDGQQDLAGLALGRVLGRFPVALLRRLEMPEAETPEQWAG
jgi:(1->4)-alpha-D-glucan 1-alpha-D-glucosylmutase